MSRTPKNRIIQASPSFSGFKPVDVKQKSGNEVRISFEEYEALNLCDYELLTQAEAAELMKISRPTFTRIYERVRRKIAQAFIEACPITFEGGNVELAVWYTCSHCQIRFTLRVPSEKQCPLCENQQIILNT